MGISELRASPHPFPAAIFQIDKFWHCQLRCPKWFPGLGCSQRSSVGLEGISWKRAVLWYYRLWELFLEEGWSVSKADTFLCLHLLLEGCLRTSLLLWFIFPHSRLNLFWDNLNLYIFVPTGSNMLNRISSFPVLIHLINLQRIISPFLCYPFFHSPWLNRPVSLSLCLEDRLLIPLAVPVVSSHVFGELSLASYYHLP